MIRQSQEREEPQKRPLRDTVGQWRQAVEGWEIPTGNFENDDNLDPADFFEPEDLPT
jgi:hypothetical protein